MRTTTAKTPIAGRLIAVYASELLVARAAAGMLDARAAARLVPVLDVPAPIEQRRRAVVDVLGALRYRPAVPALIKILDDVASTSSLDAIGKEDLIARDRRGALGAIGDPAAIPALSKVAAAAGDHNDEPRTGGGRCDRGVPRVGAASARHRRRGDPRAARVRAALRRRRRASPRALFAVGAHRRAARAGAPRRGAPRSSPAYDDARGRRRARQARASPRSLRRRRRARRRRSRRAARDAARRRSPRSALRPRRDGDARSASRSPRPSSRRRSPRSSIPPTSRG